MVEVTKVCIVCPKGCELTIKEIDPKAKELEVTGHGCNRGIAFAQQEMYDPMRTLQTTVLTAVQGFARIPVKLSGSVPKAMIFRIMKVVKKTVVDKVLKVGDVVVEDIAGTGVDLIATTDMTLYTNDKERDYEEG